MIYSHILQQPPGLNPVETREVEVNEDTCMRIVTFLFEKKLVSFEEREILIKAATASSSSNRGGAGGHGGTAASRATSNAANKFLQRLLNK